MELLCSFLPSDLDKSMYLKCSSALSTSILPWTYLLHLPTVTGLDELSEGRSGGLPAQGLFECHLLCRQRERRLGRESDIKICLEMCVIYCNLSHLEVMMLVIESV